MNYKIETKDDRKIARVFADGTEGEFEVLRALVQASFDSAMPVGMGMLHFKKGTKLDRNKAEGFINKANWNNPNSPVVQMDYVEGRQCKTTVWRKEKNVFEVSVYSYERDRGDIEVLFKLTQQTLSKERTSGQTVSNAGMFEGESLDKRLAEYGLTRNVGESDWNFRKRIFPELHKKCSDGRAYEFLMGQSVTQLDQLDALLVMGSMTSDKSPQQLKKFADGFSADPSKKYKKVA